jgi:hypothetical protein
VEITQQGDVATLMTTESTGLPGPGVTDDCCDGNQRAQEAYRANAN